VLQPVLAIDLQSVSVSVSSVSAARLFSGFCSIPRIMRPTPQNLAYDNGELIEKVCSEGIVFTRMFDARTCDPPLMASQFRSRTTRPRAFRSGILPLLSNSSRTVATVGWVTPTSVRPLGVSRSWSAIKFRFCPVFKWRRARFSQCPHFITFGSRSCKAAHAQFRSSRCSRIKTGVLPVWRYRSERKPALSRDTK